MNIKPCPFCGNNNIKLGVYGTGELSIQCWPEDSSVFQKDGKDWEDYKRDIHKVGCFAKIVTDVFDFESDFKCQEYLITMWNRRS